MAAESRAAGGRPRRTTRAPIKAPLAVTEGEPSNSPGKGKAQAPEKSAGDKLESLLTNPRSKLTKIDISDVLSYANFLDLSPKAQQRLVALLPPTAFAAFSPSVPPTHVDYAPPQRDGAEAAEPADEDRMDIDVQAPSGSGSGLPQGAQERTPATLDPTVFTSPFFLSAARTYQDHLFSGWLGKKAREEVMQFEAGVRAGTLHAPWKDEVWERDHRPQENRSQLDLTALAKRGLLQVDDILSYRKYFPELDVIVEKDILIDNLIEPGPIINVLIPPNTTHTPHVTMLVNGRGSPPPQDRMQLMEDVVTPATLESGILDIDGRIDRAHRGETGRDASRTAWKAFTVWRWRPEVRDDVAVQMLAEKGGRERVGTLFYLSTYCRDK